MALCAIAKPCPAHDFNGLIGIWFFSKKGRIWQPERCTCILLLVGSTSRFLAIQQCASLFFRRRQALQQEQTKRFWCPDPCLMRRDRVEKYDGGKGHTGDPAKDGLGEGLHGRDCHPVGQRQTPYAPRYQDCAGRGLSQQGGVPRPQAETGSSTPSEVILFKLKAFVAENMAQWGTHGFWVKFHAFSTN